MSKIFNSIEAAEKYLGVPLSSPVAIPEDANALCYDAETSDVTFYKEYEDGLFYMSSIDGSWLHSGSNTLECEVLWDEQNGYNYAYLRLATKDSSEAFTPDCLVGVETDRGYVTCVISLNGFSEYFNPSLFVYTTESLSKEDLMDVHTIKYYISDESDETVSFTEYVEIFYDGWA